MNLPSNKFSKKKVMFFNTAVPKPANKPTKTLRT